MKINSLTGLAQTNEQLPISWREKSLSIVKVCTNHWVNYFLFIKNYLKCFCHYFNGC